MAKKEKKPFSLKKEVMEWMETLVWATVAVVLVFTFLGRTAVVSGSSMLPTYHDGDRMLISSLGYTPEYGDVVVFAEKSGDKETLIKRVIATEGQTVRIDYLRGTVWVDGQVLDEPYRALLNSAGAPIGKWTQMPNYGFDYNTDIFEVTVPDGCLFVMGDNRNNSADSRFDAIGFVDERRVLGKVIYCFPA